MHTGLPQEVFNGLATRGRCRSQAHPSELSTAGRWCLLPGSSQWGQDTKSRVQVAYPDSGRGSKALKTFIKEHAAVKLRQIQDSANFFQLARDKFGVIRQSGESLRTPDEIHQSFSGLCSSLRAAEEMLIVPQLPNVQDLYTAENRSHMKPELPEDLALHFHISSVYLVLTVLIVAPSAKRPSSGQSQRSSGVCDSDTQWIGATFEYGSNVYEVVNQLQVSGKSVVYTTVKSICHSNSSIM
ncbi:Protein rogdi, partial [Geodia barretti]